MTEQSRPEILSLGEALIDEVRRTGVSSTSSHVGGSLFNVACGLAQLGENSWIGSWWGADESGQRIARSAERAGVRVLPGTDAAARTSVAHALLDDEGRAVYEFDLDWSVPPLPDAGRFAHVHTGSIAATLEPGGGQVVEAVRAIKRAGGTVSYDPNVRPAIMGRPADVVDRVEELVALSDVVKASDEDLAWLFGDEPIDSIMRRWLALGPRLMVVTRGGEGAYAALADDFDLLAVPPVAVTLVDTVGAGDSFMAGLISGLVAAGLLGSAGAVAALSGADWHRVQPALHRAVLTSAITVSRPGAYAPTLDEVHALSRSIRQPVD
ncbi:MAG TPA: carbohydrate kinase [Propionibacteriaceae bacterium]|nr:carbohydrate kinase [Propionibacteriaceae bacterium]